MKSSSLLFSAAVVALGALAGSFYVGQVAPKGASARPELRIGDQGPGPALSSGSAAWSPKRDPDGYTVTTTLPLHDSRVVRFADFPVLIPSYLPDGTRMGPVTAIWDPVTDKRIIQIAIQGKYHGILTQQRIQSRTGEYPEGIRVRTENQSNGNIFRNLVSNVEGVGVSMAWNPAISDEEIIKSFQSLKTKPDPASTVE